MLTQLTPRQPLVEIVDAPDEMDQSETAKGTAQCRMGQQDLQRQAGYPAHGTVPHRAPGREQQEDSRLDAVEDEQYPDEGARLHGGRL